MTQFWSLESSKIGITLFESSIDRSNCVRFLTTVSFLILLATYSYFLRKLLTTDGMTFCPTYGKFSYTRTGTRCFKVVGSHRHVVDTLSWCLSSINCHSVGPGPFWNQEEKFLTSCISRSSKIATVKNKIPKTDNFKASKIWGSECTTCTWVRQDVFQAKKGCFDPNEH